MNNAVLPWERGVFFGYPRYTLFPNQIAQPAREVRQLGFMHGSSCVFLSGSLNELTASRRSSPSLWERSCSALLAWIIHRRLDRERSGACRHRQCPLRSKPHRPGRVHHPIVFAIGELPQPVRLSDRGRARKGGSSETVDRGWRTCADGIGSRHHGHPHRGGGRCFGRSRRLGRFGK